ncbi:MAG: hypothetical protein VX500_07030 [Planctomycetota bacterium]|nr:hypothetical protein [Planctomycetota bacterium]MEC8162601.1 hypothetical protein [Planctomycetota bacterium]
MAIDLLNSNTVVLSEVCGWKKVDHLVSQQDCLSLNPSATYLDSKMGIHHSEVHLLMRG